MKQINISIADDELYRQLEDAAAAQGRRLNEMIAEARSEWLRARQTTNRDACRELAALRSLDEIRSRQPQQRVADDLLAEIRDERS